MAIVTTEVTVTGLVPKHHPDTGDMNGLAVQYEMSILHNAEVVVTHKQSADVWAGLTGPQQSAVADIFDSAKNLLV